MACHYDCAWTHVRLGALPSHFQEYTQCFLEILGMAVVFSFYFIQI